MAERPDVLSTQDGQHSGASVAVEPGRKVSVLKPTGADVRPLLITISWSVDTQFPGAPAPIVAPAKRQLVGVLDFGNNGANHSVIFDWGRGGQLTITATSFHLMVQNPQDSEVKFNVMAAASYGARAGTDATRVTLTNKFTVDDGNPATIFAPNFAHLVTTYLKDAGLLGRGDIMLEFLSLDGQLLYQHYPRDSTISVAVELPNDVVFVRVVKLNAGLMDGALLFHLAL